VHTPEYGDPNSRSDGQNEYRCVLPHTVVVQPGRVRLFRGRHREAVTARARSHTRCIPSVDVSSVVNDLSTLSLTRTPGSALPMPADSRDGQAVTPGGERFAVLESLLQQHGQPDIPAGRPNN
jgi:hypothetical protein